MSELPLGKKMPQVKGHDPSVLYPIKRNPCAVPVHGYDLWRSYELSWLDAKGKPQVGILELIYPVQSLCIIESKSLKLYLNGLSHVSFPSLEEVARIIRKDLEMILSSPWISVQIFEKDRFSQVSCVSKLPGTSIDSIDTGLDATQKNADLLILDNGGTREEMLSSDLLRTYCPITGQPDWASMMISYRGRAINRESLLRYICSFRDHEGFAEEVCETIYMDIFLKCSPEILSARCFYTRRGGIDITPLRCSYPLEMGDIERIRLIRQ
jgi:7-cyano-7-deazaguanine reductase